MPGGPIRVRIAPERLSSAIPRSSRSLRTARNSTMRSLTSSRPAWSASRTSRAFAGSSRSSERLPHGNRAASRGTCGSARLARSSPRALEPPELALGLLTDLVGHLGLATSRGTPRRRMPRPRRAPCGSRRSACGGCTRAAASPRPTRRLRGFASAPGARPADRAGAGPPARGARPRPPARAARTFSSKARSGE